MIEAEQLSCLLGGSEILRNVSFDLGRGELGTLVGPNGAGKSTLVRALLGLVPTSGGIRIAGKPLERYARKELARVVAYVPQNAPELARHRVEEFVTLGRYAHLARDGRLTAADRAKVRDSLEKVGVTAYASRTMSSLSGGEREKVFLAAAIAQEPQILVLDEPAAFLDPRYEAEVYAVLEELARSGTTILVVNHHLNRAAVSSDRVFALKQGRICFSGSPRELMTEELLSGLFDTRFMLLTHPSLDVPMAVPFNGRRLP